MICVEDAQTLTNSFVRHGVGGKFMVASIDAYWGG